MKKGTIIALILAAALILSGGMMLMLGLSFAGEPETMLIGQEVLITENFDSVLIDTGDCNVNVVLGKGTLDAKVVIREREETSHSVWVEDGVLKIQMKDNRTWKDYIGVNWESMEMTVYLPERAYTSLQITTTTGDIQIPEALSGSQMLLRADTGDIRCAGVVSHLLSIITDTGDIQVRGGTPEMMQLESNTGEMELEEILCDGEFHMKNNTGNVEITDVNCRILTVETSTGEQELEQVVAKEYLQTLSDTGDISLEYCDGAQVNIETNTGDVSGHFLSPKSFDAHSNTGNVRVANTPGADPCRIKSDTGDIYFG